MEGRGEGTRERKVRRDTKNGVNEEKADRSEDYPGGSEKKGTSGKMQADRQEVGRGENWATLKSRGMKEDACYCPRDDSTEEF